jgi:hypothetical protein
MKRFQIRNTAPVSGAAACCAPGGKSVRIPVKSVGSAYR